MNCGICNEKCGENEYCYDCQLEATEIGIEILLKKKEGK
jgi:hypothetical protein